MRDRCRGGAAGLAFLLLALLPLAAEARQAGPVLVHPRPHDAVVAVAVRFPAGAAQDAQGREGTAFLLGRVLEAEGERRLAPLASSLEVYVARDEFVLTLRAPVEEWDRAWSAVRELLAGPPLSDAALTRARESQRERLIFEAGAPVRAFEAERDRLFLGAAHPGARALRGTPQGLQGLTSPDLNDFRSRSLRLEEATFAVVGPITPAQVQGVLRAPTRVVGPDREPAGPGEPGSGQEQPPLPAPSDSADADSLEAAQAPPSARIRPLVRPFPPPLRVPATPSGSAAWLVGDRLLVDREVTSTWIAVAWPLPAGTPVVLMEFLAHIMTEALNPSPPDPGLYRAEVRVERLGSAPVLVVNATVDPRVTARWEDRILRSMEGVAEDPPRGAFFELTRRRFRTTRFLEQSHPEARALWLARTQALEGEVPSFSEQVWALDREGLEGLARARGEPRTLLYGPARMMEPR